MNHSHCWCSTCSYMNKLVSLALPLLPTPESPGECPLVYIINSSKNATISFTGNPGNFHTVQESGNNKAIHSYLNNVS